MQNKALIISGIVLGAIAVVIALFLPILAYNNNNVGPEPEPEPLPQAPLESLTFRLSSNTAAGNTDEYDSDSFSIYLKRGQKLYLSFYAEGAAVTLRAKTPSEEVWGYLTSTGEAARISASGAPPRCGRRWAPSYVQVCH